MGSNTIHHSAPALGSDLLAAMAVLIERATPFGISRSRWLRRAGVRVKNDLLCSDSISGFWIHFWLRRSLSIAMFGFVATHRLLIDSVNFPHVGV